MFAWLVALLPLIVVFVVCILAAARQIGAWDRRSRQLMLGVLACWIGVLVAEFVQAQLLRAGRERSIQGAIEGGLEVLGATLFPFAFVEFCAGLPRPGRRPAGPMSAHLTIAAPPTACRRRAVAKVLHFPMIGATRNGTC